MTQPTPSKLRVLILRSNPIAPDPRVEKEARSLQADGYSVSVLGWDRSGSLPVEEKTGDIQIHRLSILAGYARGVMNFFPLLLWQIALLGWLVKQRNEVDILHACDFDTILPALMCKKLFKKKIVYDIFDFYADHLRATPEWIKRLIRHIDLWAIEQTDGVILVDDARAVQISGSRPRQMAVIYNSPEEWLPPPDEVVEKQSSSSPTSLRLAYIGLLQVERGLLDVLKVLREHPDWRLDLAGFGGDEAQILTAAQDLPNIFWHGRVPYQKALELSAQADVLFALYDPAIPNHRFSSPNKLFEAMLLSKPIVVARGTNMDTIVAQTGCGLVVEYHHIEELESAFASLAHDPELRIRLGANAREAYQQAYGWAIMEKRLLKLYARMAEH
jgi:glycosyltransferase involved in cell wall biosynthesis